MKKFKKQFTSDNGKIAIKQELEEVNNSEKMAAILNVIERIIRKMEKEV